MATGQSATRQAALDAISVGDIVFAMTPGGKPKIMLVTERMGDGFRARHITSPTWVEFAADGRSRWTPDGGSCAIVSTAKLSHADHAIALGLDRKTRAAKHLTDVTLSAAEIDFLLEAKPFFQSHPLPD